MNWVQVIYKFVALTSILIVRNFRSW